MEIGNTERYPRPDASKTDEKLKVDNIHRSAGYRVFTRFVMKIRCWVDGEVGGRTTACFRSELEA